MKRLAALLVFFVVIALTTLSLTVFFKTETIKVTGNTKYDETAIIEKSGIEMGENLIMLNSPKVADTLKEEFVYIEGVRVKKNIFTGTAQILITEAEPFCTLRTENDFYLISRQGTILERLPQTPENMYTVIGLDINDAMIGNTLNSEGDEQLTVLEEIFGAIENTQMERITEIDVSDVLNISANYDNRINVEFGTSTELEYKMKYAKEVLVNKIKSYERGTLDVSYCHTSPNVVFSPTREDLSSETSSEEVVEETN